MTTVAVLQARTNTQDEDWHQVEVVQGSRAVSRLRDAAKEMNTALGWSKYRQVTVDVPESEPDFPIEPTHARRKAFAKTGYRYPMEDGNTVTASPTWLCVWGRNVGNDLIAGPFPCPDNVREPGDLVGWYDGWVEAGRPT